MQDQYDGKKHVAGFVNTETNGKIPNKYKCENDDSLLERVLPAQEGNLMPYLSEKQ